MMLMSFTSPDRALPTGRRQLAWRLFFVALLCLGALRPAAAVEQIGVHEARALALDGAITLIDIRRPQEWQASGVADVAVEIDMRAPDFLNQVRELQLKNKDRPLAFICATGGRSNRLARWFERQGIDEVIDVSAGMHGRDGWLASKLPVRAPGTAPMRPASTRAD